MLKSTKKLLEIKYFHIAGLTVVLSLWFGLPIVNTEKLLSKYNFPLHSFEQNQVFFAVQMSSSIADLGWKRIIEVMQKNVYPPLYLSGINVSAILTSRKCLVMPFLTNIPYLVIMLWGVYLCARHLKSRFAGYLAVLLISLYPGVTGPFATFCMDFGVMAIMPLTIYALIKTKYFESKFWSMVFAVLMGLGMMIKNVFLAFVFGPMVYCVVAAAFMAYKEKNARRILNLLIAGIITILVISPHYASKSSLVYLFRGPGYESGGQPWFNCFWSNLISLANGMNKELLTLPLSLLFVLGIFAFILTQPVKHIVPLISWVIIPTVIIASMPHWKSTRFCLPVLPALAIISATGLSSIKNNLYRTTLIISVVYMGLFLGYQRFTGVPERESAVNESLYTQQQRGAITQQLINAIQAEMRRNGLKSARIFVPYDEASVEGNYGYISFLDTTFWFQNRNVQVFMLPFITPAFIMPLWPGSLSYDCIIVSRKQSDSRKDLLDFTFIEHSYFMKYGIKDTFEKWENFKLSWKGFKDGYPVHRVIYDGNDFEVHLYSKK